MEKRWKIVRQKDDHRISTDWDIDEGSCSFTIIEAVLADSEEYVAMARNRGGTVCCSVDVTVCVPGQEPEKLHDDTKQILSNFKLDVHKEEGEHKSEENADAEDKLDKGKTSQNII